MEEILDNELVVDRIRMLLAGVDGIVEQRLFGTNGFLLHGNLACGPNRTVLLVRVGAAGMDAALAEPDAAPMQMGAGRTMRGFVQVALDELDETRLRYWVGVGLATAAALPPK